MPAPGCREWGVCVCAHVCERSCAYVHVWACGEINAAGWDQSNPTVKEVNGRSAVEGIHMEIRITLRTDSISAWARPAKRPLTILIQKQKLVWRKGTGQTEECVPQKYLFCVFLCVLRDGNLHQRWQTLFAQGLHIGMQTNEQMSNSDKKDLRRSACK